MTAGDSTAAMMITQPALVSSPQSRPAPTRRALPSKPAAQGGQNWMPIRGQICKPIDTKIDFSTNSFICASPLRRNLKAPCAFIGLWYLAIHFHALGLEVIMSLTIICLAGAGDTHKSKTIREFTAKYLKYKRTKGDVLG